MSDVIDRPILAREATANSRLRIIDCDIHPSIRAHSDLNEFLPKRWQQHLATYGSHLRTPYIGTTPYPRSSPLIARRDLAWMMPRMRSESRTDETSGLVTISASSAKVSAITAPRSMPAGESQMM